jgi:virginiamycin A acetyltransferase
MWSTTYRELMRSHYGVSIGIHSYGPCLLPGHLPAGTRVGNYCSLAGGLQVFRRNHPVDRISQHPFFFNAAVGLLDRDTIPAVEDNPLTIGHDVWIGQNVLIAPGCRSIGHGAVVASGAVVTADVAACALVGGVPAKLIRWRLSEELRAAWLRSEWWLKPVSELAEQVDTFTEPYCSNHLTCKAIGSALHCPGAR